MVGRIELDDAKCFVEVFSDDLPCRHEILLHVINSPFLLLSDNGQPLLLPHVFLFFPSDVTGEQRRKSQGKGKRKKKI